MSAIEKLINGYVDRFDPDYDNEKEDELLVKQARAELFEMITALVASEKYMTGQRAKSKAPFDPEALKRTRAVLAKLEKRDESTAL